jgi:hypothetical protein
MNNQIAFAVNSHELVFNIQSFPTDTEMLNIVNCCKCGICELERKDSI